MAQIKLAEYTFDNSVGDCLPTLRLSSIEMTTEDIVSGAVTRRTVYIDDATLPYQLYFQNQTALLTVDYLHIGSNITNLASLFSGCTKLKTVNTTNWDLSSCTNISFMFQNCSSLTKLDLRNWVTGSITTMQGMFHSCTSLTEIKGIENFNVTSSTSFGAMFYKCSSLTKLDLRNWVTSSATSFQDMFSSCSSLEVIRVDNFDTSKVTGTGLNSMFSDCTKVKTLNLNSFVNAGLGNFLNFCYKCESLEYISTQNFIWGKHNSSQGLFTNCKSLKYLDFTTFDGSTIGTTTVGLRLGNSLDGVTCPIYYNSNMCTANDTELTNKSNAVDVQGRLMAIYDFNNSVTSTDVYPVLTGSTVTKTIDTVGSESHITHRVIGVDVMPTAISFQPVTGLLNVDYLAVTSSCTSLQSMFQGCIRLDNVNTFGWDTSNVTDMSGMFIDCGSLKSIDLSNLNTSSCTTLLYLFQRSGIESLDLSSWDVSHVEDMSSVFSHCSSLTQLNVKGWDTSSVTSMNYMFEDCSGLTELDLISFNTSNVTGTVYTFAGWSSSQIVYVHDTNWTISTNYLLPTFVRRLSKLIAKYTFDNSIGDCLPTITGITTSDYKVSDIVNDTVTTRLLSTDSTSPIIKIQFGVGSIPNKASLRTVEYYNTTDMTDMASVFNYCQGLTYVNTDGWDTSKVTTFNRCFSECYALNELDTTNIDTSSATNLESMFYCCTALTDINVKDWNVSKVTTMKQMFSTTHLTSVDVSGWNAPNLTDMSSMFAGHANQPYLQSVNMSNWTMGTPANMNSMFYNNPNLTSIDFTGSKMISSNLQQTFQNCSKLTSLDVSSWNFEKCTAINQFIRETTNLVDFNMSGVTFGATSVNFQNFAYQSGVQNVNMSNIITAGKVSFESPFYGCGKLKTIDFSNSHFKPSTTQNMFRGCSSLTSVDLSSFDTSQVTSMSDMFNGCSSLTSLDLSSWNTSSCTNMASMFRDTTSLLNVDVLSFNIDKVISMDFMFSNCAVKQLDISSFKITDSTTFLAQMFVDSVNLESVDLSNLTRITTLSTYLFRKNTSLKTIGMLYSSAESINNLLSVGFHNNTLRNGITIYYYDADPSQLTPVEGVTFKKYAKSTKVQLPPHIQLHSLPDGTRDEVDIKTGILTRNVTVFTADEVKSVARETVSTDGKWAGYWLKKVGEDDNNNLSALYYVQLTNKLPVTSFISHINDTTYPYIGLRANKGGISLRIPTNEVVGTDKNGCLQWLKDRNIVFYCKNQTPTTEQLILNYNNSCDYGRILPTGMCDKYDVVNSMYTQTMTSILLDGANTWDAMEEMTNVIKFTATGTTVGVEELNMLGAGGLYCDNDLFPNINDDSDVPHCRVDETGNKFYIYVDKDMLMSPDLIGWQIWLQANNFNLIYELAEHLTYVKPYEELDPTQARWEGMDCMRDGAIRYHTNSSDNITMYPTLEYVAPSINNFEVTMLEPNTDYTIYAEGINKNDTINLGGTDINFNNGTVYTSGDNQWLRIDNNDSFYNMVITKGDTTGEVVPYFEGMTSVENPKVQTPTIINGLLSTAQGKWESSNHFGGSVVYVPMIDVKVGQKYIIASSSRILVAVWRSKTWVSNDVTQIEYADVLPDRPLIFTPDVSQVAIFMVVAKHLTDKAHEVELRMYEGEVDYGYLGRVENPKVIIERSTVSYTDLKLRSLPNGVKDTINVVTGEYVQRVGEVVLNGSEDWVLSAHDNSTSFYTPLNDLVHKEDYLNSISCDKFVTHTYEWTLHNSISLNGISAYVDWLNDYPNENWLYIKHANSESSVEKFKQWLKENPVTVQYELAEPITTKLDPQTLLAYTDGTINLSSDTGLLPTTHYTVPSTNTFHLPSMKTGTRYTLKYPSASGSITIGDINYSISSDSMLFTTPLKINGDTSAIIFSDANPENVILLEGAYNKREVPFFTGVKSVKNPNITIIDQLSTESTTYNCETEIELRGLPNGVADKLDIIKGKLTTNVGIRPYQEGDENLPNIWTDGYETVYALSSPVVTNVTIDQPTVTTNSLIELSSDYLIPQLNYRAPSSNNFPLDLLQPNTTYTLYADTLTSGSYTLGGTRTGVYSQPHIITLGDITDNLLTFNGDLGLSNVMLVKGNSLKTTLPPYFLGIRSVTDGHLLVEGMAGEINELTFDEGIVLRDCNGVKDFIDLMTCTLTKRTGEITLTGAEGWYRADNESTTDYNVFKLTLGGLKEALVMCDTLQSVFDTKMMDCIHAHINELCIVIANATIGGNTVNALKSWLNQHPTTVVYQLRTPIEVQLENTWTTTPPTSYDNQTEISSTVSTNSLKPMISVTIATTTLEEIVSNLETQNAQLEEENLATMLALTEVYEMMYTSTVDDDAEPASVSTWNRRIIVSSIGMVYAKLVKRGVKSIENIPTKLQVEVQYAIDNGLV